MDIILDLIILTFVIYLFLKKRSIFLLSLSFFYIIELFIDMFSSYLASFAVTFLNISQFITLLLTIVIFIFPKIIHRNI
ncbi:hypothetical protein CP523_04445 [Clostridium septicum]|uniref:Uncharacterized protein n=1 Tax=Clostridium septicum TaxID=1504 RepID=A0A9N7PIJ6_CLOSE|nr:hypothetical protein [Clostridium septicum]AYE33776.1 hypothetical protein CP523_04445 [Clostridium septicum]USS00336.1 hypothetical protein NH397_12690 [Clostridium septicum]WLF68887.1 hypothetical protein Q6375_13005 [Clostridium septicum]